MKPFNGNVLVSLKRANADDPLMHLERSKNLRAGTVKEVSDPWYNAGILLTPAVKVGDEVLFKPRDFNQINHGEGLIGYIHEFKLICKV